MKKSKYIRVKRYIDVILSAFAMVILSPLFFVLIIAIKVDSRGPVLFRQKRVGIYKKHFDILKFRTMKIDTPKDMPTHMLENPEQYITRVGKFLRKTSLDELPQIINILKGDMSIIGPRPALWNQFDLIEERDKYGANDVVPGLTGWAQINGRDELEIPVKAKLDGEYVEKLGFRMDVKCFLGTIGSVLFSDGVVEGGTGEMSDKEIRSFIISPEKVKREIAVGAGVVSIVGAVFFTMIGFILRRIHKKRTVERACEEKKCVKQVVFGGAFLELVTIIFVNLKRRVKIADDFVNDDRKESIKQDFIQNNKNNECIKKILITGANSYIGTSVESWLSKESGSYQIDTLDMVGESWKECDFSSYDVVYHVAGIAHADVGKVSEEQKQLYYRVNRDLAIEVAEKSKDAGVRQFILMSSMIVYSGCKEKVITSKTQPKALNFYGDSKWQADKAIRDLQTDDFKVVVLRPPMIYGKGSKGNYPELSKLAGKLPFFPIVKNKRSMLHISNLCEFVKLMIDNEESGVFFPQNEEYTNTSDMVQMIADVKGHRIIMLPGTNYLIKLLEKFPGKIGGLATKAFGDLAYEMEMSDYKINYRVSSLRESIELTEE